MTLPRSASAFTILELLVAASISMVLAVLLLVAAQGMMSTYTRTQATIIRQGDIGFALDQIVQDLEGIVIPNSSGAEGLRISTESVGQLTNAVWLTLLSTAIDKDPGTNSGATRAVSIKMAYQNTIDISSAGGEKSHAIYRSVAPAKHTFDNAIGATNLQTGYWNSVPPSPAPTPTAMTSLGNLLTENVVGMSVRFLYQDASGKMVWSSPGALIRIGQDGSFINGVKIDGGFLRAEVSVTALSSEGVKALQRGMAMNDAIQKYGQTAVRQTAFF